MKYKDHMRTSCKSFPAFRWKSGPFNGKTAYLSYFYAIPCGPWYFVPIGVLIEKLFLVTYVSKAKGFYFLPHPFFWRRGPTILPYQRNSHFSATATPRCLEPPPLDLKVTSGLTHVSNSEKTTPKCTICEATCYIFMLLFIVAPLYIQMWCV